MKQGFFLGFVVLLACFAFYMLGKKNGSNNTKLSLLQNISLVKEIAELGALSVSGSTEVKSTNKDESNGFWSRVKNYMNENTLQVTIPFDAKYGVDMSNQQLEINTKDSTVIIYLPASKLLSLQLRLDKISSINKTGVFSNTSIDEFIATQKYLYEKVSSNLEEKEEYKRSAENHIQSILQKYYEPLGFKVKCVFGEKKNKLQ